MHVELLTTYLTNVSFYFVLKASGTNDIRDHPVINALVDLRSKLDDIEQVEVKLRPRIDAFMDALDAPVEEERIPEKTVNTAAKKEKKKTKKAPAHAALANTEPEEELEDDNQVPDIETAFKSLKKSAKKRKRAAASDDFGELDALDELDMEDKAARKRSIRDYVAKIDAKTSQQHSKYQGDIDIPYKDRKNRPEKKGVQQPEDTSADLDDADYDASDLAIANSVRTGKGDGDDMYAELAAQREARKAEKIAEYEANAEPIHEGDWEVSEGQKRLASYRILKNRGLTPHRKKENRNSRVKHKNRYAKQLKKLANIKPMAKSPKGSYGGEMTGIKSNLVKSVQF